MRTRPPLPTAGAVGRIATTSAVAACLVLGAGCVDDDRPSSGGGTEGAGAATTTTEVPDDASTLVGLWTSTAEDNVEIVYRFHADGTYESAHVAIQVRSDGTFRLEIGAAGTYSADGATLELRPDRGREVRRDSAFPAEDYDRPVDTAAQTYRWSIRAATGPDELTLVAPDGAALTLAAS